MHLARLSAMHTETAEGGQDGLRVVVPMMMMTMMMTTTRRTVMMVMIKMLMTVSAYVVSPLSCPWARRLC